MVVSSSMDSRITHGQDLECEYRRGEQGCQRGLDAAVREGNSAAVMILGVRCENVLVSERICDSAGSGGKGTERDD